MGWSNYLVLPKLKLAFEISRYIDDLEYGEQVVTVMVNAIELAHSVDLEIPYHNLTLSKVTSLTRIAGILKLVDDNFITNIGIQFLLEYDENIRLIHQEEAYLLEKNEGYTLIQRSFKDD